MRRTLLALVLLGSLDMAGVVLRPVLDAAEQTPTARRSTREVRVTAQQVRMSPPAYV